MSKEIKARYDKNLKKYHIEYHKLQAMPAYRFEIFHKLNATEDLALRIETFLGSVSKPEPMLYARSLEGLFAKYGLAYMVRPVEVQASKSFFDFLGRGKKTETHYAITFIVPKGALDEAMFEAFFCEFDLQVGYGFKQAVDTYLDDVTKGYVDNVFDEGYFSNSFYDSRLFNKFLATEDLSKLLADTFSGNMD